MPINKRQQCVPESPNDPCSTNSQGPLSQATSTGSRDSSSAKSDVSGVSQPTASPTTATTSAPGELPSHNTISSLASGARTTTHTFYTIHTASDGQVTGVFTEGVFPETFSESQQYTSYESVVSVVKSWDSAHESTPIRSSSLQSSDGTSGASTGTAPASQTLSASSKSSTSSTRVRTLVPAIVVPVVVALLAVVGLYFCLRRRRRNLTEPKSNLPHNFETKQEYPSTQGIPNPRDSGYSPSSSYYGVDPFVAGATAAARFRASSSPRRKPVPSPRASYNEYQNGNGSSRPASQYSAYARDRNSTTTSGHEHLALPPLQTQTHHQPVSPARANSYTITNRNSTPSLTEENLRIAQLAHAHHSHSSFGATSQLHEYPVHDMDEVSELSAPRNGPGDYGGKEHEHSVVSDVS